MVATSKARVPVKVMQKRGNRSRIRSLREVRWAGRRREDESRL
jgi:hypothetical protein